MNLKPYDKLNNREKSAIVDLMMDLGTVYRIPKDDVIEKFYDKLAKLCEVLKGE